MEEKHMRPLPINFLWDGMELHEDIYNHTGKVLLIPKGEIVTREKLVKLLSFDSEDRHIMVYDDTYREIMSSEHVPTEERKKMTDSYVGYSRITSDIEKLFDQTDSTSWLQMDVLGPLIHEITSKVMDIDPVMIFSCISFPRPMDEGLQRHSLNVALLNGMIGEWLGLSKETVRMLVLAGLLHDIGKTKVPEEILNAPRKLTPEEFELVKMHPVYSEELLKDKFDENVCLVAKCHHEKLDGSGYPEGLSGDEIPYFARITAVSDIYDAMVEKRSYKGENLPLTVLDMFYNGEFGGLDRDLVMLFLKNMRENYVGKTVLMSNNKKGTIRYIPPNDAEHPVVQQGEAVRQTNEYWYCKEILSAG